MSCKYAAKKTSLLGMPHGTAMWRMRKATMFRLAVKCGENFCFRCDKEIKTVDEFSIDHKLSWQMSDDPIKNFFDQENISFSHRSCNSADAYRERKYVSKKERNRINYWRSK